MERKVTYPHCHQTRLRDLDEPQTELAVINEEEDTDTKASGSWAAPIPRYNNHKVRPRIDVWAEKRSYGFTLYTTEQPEAVQWRQGRSTPEAPEANARGSRCRDQIEA
jgi:hypothetical protein